MILLLVFMQLTRDLFAIAKFLFSVVIMGSVTHILPVLHCLKRGIAFVSSLFLYCATD